MIEFKNEAHRTERVINWDIDTDYCHHGIPLSNGVMGALIWFQNDRIMVTINRTDFWDHRGGTEWTEEINYATMKGYLQSGDFEAAKNMFRPMYMNGQEKRPTRLPMGRFDLCLYEGITVNTAMLHLDDAEARIQCKLSNGKIQEVRISVLMDQPVLLLSGGSKVIESVNLRPSFEFPRVLEYYNQFDIIPGKKIAEGESKGWYQELPVDPANAVWSEWNNDTFMMTSVYGKNSDEAIQVAKNTLNEVRTESLKSLIEKSQYDWKALWNRAAKIKFPEKSIENIYYLGIYKMLGNSMPGKVAPTLQGPWIEEYRLPAWSSDYHFNINVQECLWPAYGANLLECLDPLFLLIDSWKPRLALNAKNFVGIEDGYMLNHSTDDRGTPSGGMWTGTIDHANTSWVAQMMWLKYSYSMDETYLIKEVYPFMKKAMNVYIALMEKEGEQYFLPISVSPEYGGSGPNALGRNSSFFLANIHFLCEKIIDTASKHKIDQKYVEKMKEIQTNLPLYTTGKWQTMEWPRNNPISDQEIYLWENQPLEVSHRHHSHLAGLYPFDVIDLADEEQKAVVSNSIKSWIDKGMARWSGWAMPWASILHNRVGNKDSAYLMLKLYKEVFMNKGYASQHDGSFPGFTQFIGGETMQVEASIAMSAAIMEMFVQSSRGRIKVFPGLPTTSEKEGAFDDIRAEGAFLISGQMKAGEVKWVKIVSEQGAPLLLENPYGERAYIHRKGSVKETKEKWISLSTEKNEEIWIKPVT